MSLERDIHKLLHAHDCVIVPGFGGFLAHYRPARLDEQRQLVHPPAKDLSFNRHLLRTDGLLAQEVARSGRLDHQQAERAVDQAVEQWRARLRTTGRLELDRIGIFFHDSEKNLQFAPDKRTNFLKDAYGMRPVAAVPIPEVTPKVVSIAPVPVNAERQEERAGIPRWWSAVAAVAVVTTLGTWWLLGAGKPITTDLALFSPEEPRHYKPLTEASFLPATAWSGTSEDTAPWSAPGDRFGVEQLPIAGPDGPLVAVDLGPAPVNDAVGQAPVVKPVNTAVATRAVGLKYHIIGGCFQDKENADRFTSELQAKGFAAHVLDQRNGLYRVAYGSYAQRSMA
ncbi:MAG TPA: SPOR domain-containing protein, partial [Flavobacteriales bacterium]